MTTTQALPRTPSGWVEIIRSGPAEDQYSAAVAAVYRLWLAAFTLKMLGASWDVSWHFKWLRDDFAPPHLLNTVGTVIAVGLVLFQARHMVGVDRRARFLMVLGTGLFLIAIPLDVVNHRVNGLDITAWSPSHSLLYIGTALMLLGAARGWWISTAPGWRRTVVAAVFSGFFLENVLFPTQHQEYGVLSLEAWIAGRPTAEPSLLAFAANQIGRDVDLVAISNFALPVGDWMYPAWISGAALLTLVGARTLVGAPWTATVLAGGYLAYRLVAWGLLVATGFPPSIPPFLLLGGALAIDLVFLAFTGRHGVGAAMLGTALAVGAVAGLGWLQDFLVGAPPIGYLGYLWGGIILLAGWLAFALLPARRPVRQPV